MHDRTDFLSLEAIHQCDLIRYLAGEVEENTGMSLRNERGAAPSIVTPDEEWSFGQVILINAPIYTGEVEELTLRFEQAVCRVRRWNVNHQEKLEPTYWQEPAAWQMYYRSSRSTISGGMKDLYMRGFVGEMQHFKAAVEAEMHPSDFQDNIKTMS